MWIYVRELLFSWNISKDMKLSMSVCAQWKNVGRGCVKLMMAPWAIKVIYVSLRHWLIPSRLPWKGRISGKIMPWNVSLKSAQCDLCWRENYGKKPRAFVLCHLMDESWEVWKMMIMVINYFGIWVWWKESNATGFSLCFPWDELIL